jgi:hypothetical protein
VRIAADLNNFIRLDECGVKRTTGPVRVRGTLFNPSRHFRKGLKSKR